jgi:hypothetical protein
MAWLEWMLMGAGALKSYQVCRRGVREMEDHDASEESWKSIVQAGITDLDGGL